MGVQWLQRPGRGADRAARQLGRGVADGHATTAQSRQPTIRPARGRTVLAEALSLAASRRVRVRRFPSGRPRGAHQLDGTRPSSTSRTWRPDRSRPSTRSIPTTARHSRSSSSIAVSGRSSGPANARITAWCHGRARPVCTITGISDRLFTMSRTWADLRMIDGAIDPSEADHPVVLRRRAEAGERRRVRHRFAEHVPDMAEHVEPHRHRTAAALAAPRPDSTCRPCSSSRTPTTAFSRRRPTRSSPLLRRPTRSTSRCPVITTSWSLRPQRDQVADVVADWSTPADREIALPGVDGGGDVLATPG